MGDKKHGKPFENNENATTTKLHMTTTATTTHIWSSGHFFCRRQPKQDPLYVYAYACVCMCATLSDTGGAVQVVLVVLVALVTLVALVVLTVRLVLPVLLVLLVPLHQCH